MKQKINGEVRDADIILPASCRFDLHLILNALSRINLEAYQVSGREVPSVLLLSEYIKTEHMLGMGAAQAEGVQQPSWDELQWRRCEAILKLKAVLMGLHLDLEVVGTESAIAGTRIFTLLIAVLKSWSLNVEGDVLIHIDVGMGGIRVAGTCRSTGSVLDADAGFLGPALDEAHAAGALPSEWGYKILDNNFEAWVFVLTPSPFIAGAAIES